MSDHQMKYKNKFARKESGESNQVDELEKAKLDFEVLEEDNEEEDCQGLSLPQMRCVRTAENSP